MRFVFIYRHRYQYPVKVMCRVLRVSRSGYYGFMKKRGKRLRHAEMIIRIREIHQRSRYTYGSRRIMHQLRNNGIMIGRYRVRRLMRLAGIMVKRKRRYRVTTRSNHRYPVSPNLVARNFRAHQPNRVWASDITYIRTLEGWLYLAVVLDLFSRKVVGWAMARRMTVELVKKALLMAVGRRGPGPGLIHHSDRGIQYACHEYRRILGAYDMVSSMSGKGDCLDNAVVERFFRTLKTETLEDWKYLPVEYVKRDIVDFIEVFYNNQRLHSYNKYCSPNNYERSCENS